jgi:septal ring factor EnvC (AmiA/AmiB activator)
MRAKIPSTLPSRRRSLLAGALCACLASAAGGQAPVEDLTNREQAIQRSQARTGAAYRELQQAKYDSKLAEQDFLNAQDAQKAAQKQADDAKQKLDAAKKALDAARTKEAQAQKRYDDALSGVDRAFEAPPAKK